MKIIKDLERLRAIVSFEFLRFFNLKSELFGLGIIICLIVFRGASSILFSLTTEIIDIAILSESYTPKAYQEASPDHAKIVIKKVTNDETFLIEQVRMGNLDGYLKLSDTPDKIVFVSMQAKNWESRLKPLAQVLQKQWLEKTFQRPVESFDFLFEELTLIQTPLDDSKQHTSQTVWGISMAILVISVMAILTAFGQLVSGITSEKFGKLSEMILATIPASLWLDGKVIAAALHGLKVFFSYLIFSLVGLEFMGVIVVSEILNEHGQISNLLLLSFVFLVGYIFWCYLYCLLSVLIQSPNSQVKNTLSILPLVILAVCITGFGSIDSLFMGILAYFPLTYSFAMPLQIISGELGVLSVIFPTALTLASAIFCRHLAIRCFARDVMKSSSWSGSVV